MAYSTNLPKTYDRVFEKTHVVKRIMEVCKEAVDISEGKYEPKHHEHITAHEAAELGSSIQEGPHLPVTLRMLLGEKHLFKTKTLVRTVGVCKHIAEKSFLCTLNAAEDGANVWRSVALEGEGCEHPPSGPLQVFGSVCRMVEGQLVLRVRMWQQLTLHDAQMVQEMCQWHPVHALRNGTVPQHYLDKQDRLLSSSTSRSSSWITNRLPIQRRKEKEVPYLPVPMEQLVLMERLAQKNTLVRTVGFSIYYNGQPVLCSLEAAMRLAGMDGETEVIMGPWRCLPLEVQEGALPSLPDRRPLQLWAVLSSDKDGHLLLKGKMWQKPSLWTAFDMQTELCEEYKKHHLEGFK